MNKKRRDMTIAIPKTLFLLFFASTMVYSKIKKEDNALKIGIIKSKPVNVMSHHLLFILYDTVHIVFRNRIIQKSDTG